MKIRLTLFIYLTACFVFASIGSAGAAARLSFEDRVRYQRAIEEVTWRHTIWPAENQQPKPALREVLSDKEIRTKVAGYLRKSGILGDHIQAEMNRMAVESKNPQLLRELWAALGNNPFVIAECFVRPILADKSADRSTTFSFENVDNSEAFQYRLPSIPAQPFAESGEMAPAPRGRWRHSAVWTGTEMIVWGGYGEDPRYLRSGGRYNPATNSWAELSLKNAPPSSSGATAVWTGTAMIVWGGYGFSGALNSGGVYNPATNSWRRTSDASAPSQRDSHTAIWTGKYMIIWGGSEDFSDVGPSFNTGALYDPLNNTWTETAVSGAPETRALHTATWTGKEMIIWGGCNDACWNVMSTGGRYNPSTNTWSPTNQSDVPIARSNHTAVFTGTEMIIWGGCTYDQGCAPHSETGGRYNPASDSWTAVSVIAIPKPRMTQDAIWTGQEMIVWGAPRPGTNGNNGGRYSPATNTWLGISNKNAPSHRWGNTMVWTGTQLIIWGGSTSKGVLNTGRIYTPSTDSWSVIK